MRKVTTRALRSNLGHELDDLPFIITRHGVELAMCTQIISGLKDLKEVEHTKPKCVHNSKSEKKRVAVQDSSFVPYSKDKQLRKKNKK